MKKSLITRFRILLLVFFAIFIAESALILNSALGSTGIDQLQSTLYSIVIVFIFIQFVYVVILFYLIPYEYDRDQKEVLQIIHNISEGKYEIELDSTMLSRDVEVLELLTALQKMMKIVNRFDNLKTDKIQENQHRIQELINMLPQGCLIISAIGEIVYLNAFIKKHFPALTENLNIVEILLPEAVENELKPIILESIKTREHLHNRKVTIASEDITYNLNSSIVRNNKGQTAGAIFLIVKA